MSSISKRNHPNVNRISGGDANQSDNMRPVYIVSRPIGGKPTGFIRTFLESTAELSSSLHLVPSPLYHWAVRVGDFYHQLQATGLSGDIWYENDRLSPDDGWRVFQVGETKFNDVAIKEAGEKAILTMPETYELRTNNCQRFVCILLDLIAPGRRRMMTSYSFDAIAPAPKFEYNPETGKFEVIQPPKAAVAKEEAVLEIEENEMLEEAKRIMMEETPGITEEMEEKLIETDIDFGAPLIMTGKE